MFKKITPSLMLLGLLAGCAKEKPYDEVNKTADLQFPSAHQKKTTLMEMCTTEDPCLYLPSVANTPYAVTASRPFWQGEQKLVIANMTNDKLQFLQVESDERFDDNINNLSPVLNISVDHIDYKCTEDEYGDCTNKEEVDSEKPWEKRKYVKLNDIDVVETNSLPIEFGELFQSGCFSETDKTINKLDIVKDAINVIVKKTYKASANCATLNEMADLRYLTFTVDYTYSIVKLSSLTDSAYKTTEYPQRDEAHFGYFTTEQKTKTVDNHDHVVGVRRTLMNRWSPNREKVVYKLNSEFYTPENKIILDATKQAITTVNASLKRADAKFQIELQKGEDDKIGDLRENFIILVKDPQASGVIGYGPSVTNPKTGEIINARTVMYFGTIQKFVSRAYDELVEEVIERVNGREAEASASTSGETSSEGGTSGAAISSAVSMAMQAENAMQFSNYVLASRNIENLDRIDPFSLTKSFGTNSAFGSMDEIEMAKAQLNKYLKRENGVTFQDKIAKMAEETFFHASYVNFDDAVIKALEEDIAEKKSLKMWDDLSEEERAEVMKKLVPYVWVPTLVHEFGHNLGLRHNFNGSTDKDNYYSTSERRALGMTRDVTYSSIMDYAPKTNNELFVMGKYDVAALRFAYAREVESKSGQMIPFETVVERYNSNIDTLFAMVSKSEGAKVASEIKGELEKAKLTSTLKNYFAIVGGSAASEVESAVAKSIVERAAQNAQTLISHVADKGLRNFMYCSDEHVSNDPLCNRFDDGDTYEKVITNFIDSYKKNYEKVNFRGRRYDYESRSGDWAYLNRLFGTFQNIRQFFEIYDQRAFGGAYEKEEEWTKDARLVDIKKAADKSFAFFMDVIEEPSYHCIKINPENGQVESVKPFAEMAKGTQLEEYGITFDIRFGCLLLNNYGEKGKVYAEFGKYFNNSLDLLYDKSQINTNDSSQIDVRGVWMDKLIATIFTSIRFTSPTTIGSASSGNYFDYPEYKERLISTMDSLLTNEMTKEVPVTLPNGNVINAQMSYGFEGNHHVNKSYNWIVNAIFGLHDSRTNLKSTMMSYLKGYLLNEQMEGEVDNNDALTDYYGFTVDRVSTRIDLSRFNYDKIVEFENKAGKVNYRFGLYSYNQKAIELAALKEKMDTIKIVDQSLVPLAAQLFALPDGMNLKEILAEQGFDEQKISDIEGIMEMGQDFVNGYLSGSINDQVILSSLLALSKKPSTL